MENNLSSTKIRETPHVPCRKKRISAAISGRTNTRASYNNSDSGYITVTPHSADTTVCTPLANSGCRLRSGCSNSGSTGRRRYHRVRTSDPWQSERTSRFRSKLNTWLDVPEGADCSSSFTRAKSEVRDDHDCCSIFVNKNNTSDFDGLLRARLRSNANTGERLTSVPTTPASSLQLLSPPPSPAVPSLSFVATEPIEDVEMKLVIVPQSTPHLMPTQVHSAAVAVSSPTTSRTSPSFSSVENHNKLSKLMITDLTMSDIRPKRLDFSQRPKYSGLQRVRALPYLAGKLSVDFMSLLGEESDHWRIVSKILSLLSSQDLCAISMVSKTWRRICARDSRANIRRLGHIIIRKNAKENLKLIRAKAKAENELLASPRSHYVRKGFLVEVQNLLQVPMHSHRTPSSPPVSPSKVKFHSFVKAGRTLEPSEHLLRCPRCSFACHVNGEKNIATCSRQGCSMEFCMSCSSQHTGPCKTALLATPTKRNKRLIVGSRQSKRNLRRL